MPFSKENTYTTDYIYSLPELQRAELFDGVFYDMGKRKRTTVSGIYDNRYGRWCHTFDWRGDLLEK